jgi:outer membrane protein assembly factor BamB
MSMSPTTAAGGGVGAASAGALTAGAGAGGAPGAGGPAIAPDQNTWPMMGYDTNNNYNNVKETILTLQSAPMLAEKWRFKVSGFPPGTPIIAEGKVFVMATAGTYGINLADGSQAWARTDLGGTASCAYDSGFVYVHTFDSNLYKLKASDGSTVWGPILTNPIAMSDGESSPIVAKGMVFVGHSHGQIELGSGDVATARGGVEAFKVETGERAWTYFTVPATGENGANVWSSVSVDLDTNTLFAATGNNYSVQGENSDSIHALDLMTGTKKWKTQVHDDDTWSLIAASGGPDTDFGANPILATIDGKQVVADGDKNSDFHVFDRETGAILWEKLALSSARNAQNGGILMNGAWDGKYFYVVANQPPAQAVLHALDPAKMGADAWPAHTFSELTWGAPALANGVLLVPNGDKLYVMNAMTGDMIKMFATGGTIAAGSPAIVDGWVCVGSGLSYALDPSALNNDEVVCYATPDATVAAPPTTAPTMPTAGSGGTPPFTPGSATWTAIFQEIIAGTGCNGGVSCHAGTAAGNLLMKTQADAYTALVGVAAMGMNVPAGGTNCKDTNMQRVVAGDPTNSLLYQKISAAMPPCGAHMPPGGNLTAAQISQIQTWIMNGAMNN